MSMSRTNTLETISEIMMPNGYFTRKLDFLGVVRVYGQHYSMYGGDTTMYMKL